MRLILSFVLVMVVFSLKAQTMPIRPKLSSVFLELGGQTGYYGVYYDMVFYRPNKKVHSAAALGFSVVPYYANDPPPAMYILPIQYHWLLGRESDYLELGAGANIMFLPEVKKPLFWGGIATIPPEIRFGFAPHIGYRHQPTAGGFLCKIDIVPIVINPLIGIEPIVHQIIPLSVSLGYTF